MTSTSTANNPIGMTLSPSVLSNHALSGIYGNSMPAPNVHDQFSTLNYIQVGQSDGQEENRCICNNSYCYTLELLVIDATDAAACHEHVPNEQ